MSESVNLATAYVTIIPTTQGAEQSIAQSLTGAATSAGSNAGTAASTAMGASLGKSLTENASSIMGAAGLSMGNSLTDSIGTAAKAGAPVAIAAAAAACMKALYDVGATFDDMYDTIQVGTGATGDALDDLKESAKDVLASVPASADEVGSAIADVNTRLGLTGDDLEHVASQFLEASRILGTDVDVNTATAAFNAFGLESDQIADAMDDLFTVSQATGIGMNELASSVSSNAAAMQQLGFSFGETASLAGQFDKAGLSSSAMMSAMSKGMVSLAQDGEEPAEAFERVTGELQALIDSGDEAAAIDLASGIFGTKNAAKFVGAVQSGTLNIEDMTAALEGNDNAILDTAEDTSDLSESVGKLGNTFLTAIEPLASSVFSGLTQVVDALIPMLEKIAPLVEFVANIVGAALTWAFEQISLVFDFITLVIDTIGKLLTGDLSGAIQGVIDFFGKLGNKILEAIGDAGEWLIDIGKNVIEGFKNGIKSAWDGFVGFWKGLFGGLKDTAEDELGIQSPSKVFKKIGGYVTEGFALGIASNADMVTDAMDGITDSMGANVTATIEGGNLTPAGYSSPITIQNLTVQADDVLTADKFVGMVRRAASAY